MATDEQQLEELQRRFHLMGTTQGPLLCSLLSASNMHVCGCIHTEGERKMTYEAAQQTLKQNKDTIKTLKEEAKCAHTLKKEQLTSHVPS